MINQLPCEHIKTIVESHGYFRNKITIPVSPTRRCQKSKVRLKRTRRGRRRRVRILLEFGAVMAIAQEIREGHTSQVFQRDFMAIRMGFHSNCRDVP